MELAAAALVGAAGFVAGAINALAGGGSLVSFPALVASGLAPLEANVTNSVAVWPGYVGSVAAYRRELATQRRRALPLAATGVGGGAVGSALLLLGPESAFEAVVPALVLAGSLLLALQPRLGALLQRRAGPAGRDRTVPLHLATFLAATYGAYFGGGLGVVLLATLGIFVADHLQRLNALKALLSLVINLVALVAYSVFGPVHWISVAVVAPAALAGGYAGARLARWLPPSRLRAAVVTFGVAVALWLAVRR